MLKKEEVKPPVKIKRPQSSRNVSSNSSRNSHNQSSNVNLERVIHKYIGKTEDMEKKILDKLDQKLFDYDNNSKSNKSISDNSFVEDIDLANVNDNNGNDEII